MCGIFSYFGTQFDFDTLKRNFDKIQKRGPDNSVIQLINDKFFFGFHRLSINDISEKGNQPIYHPNNRNLVLICNGEIYNSQKLIDTHDFVTYSNSDCEVILHMYQKFGILDTVKALDGVFAFVLYDGDKNCVYSARDPGTGVRPLFIGKALKNPNNETTDLINLEILFSSEIKVFLNYRIPRYFSTGNLLG